ncbi:hypothetical protein BC941DRAFT_357733 [Chlamydoabsidia padenii]|nr:hypothetical protein BC941DRAFT_357733 [Chlamydoabsidia padenii]
MDRLSSLPTEILRQVLTHLTIHDLSCIRLASKKLALLADHPSLWRHVQLLPVGWSTIHLWQLDDLRRILTPHLQLIQSIQIWGVRDNIVRYILAHCVNLTDLTLCGWVTLSNHAFKGATVNKRLRRLVLVGAPNQPNYTALDATTLASLLFQHPLQELSLGCQVHIHADTFLTELDRRTRQSSSKSNYPTVPFNRARCSLQQLTLATRRTWSIEHVKALFDTCPCLRLVGLCPTAANGFDLTQGKTMDQQQPCHDSNGDMIIHRSDEILLSL